MSSESPHFDLEITADGSPTLREGDETMHNRQGAYSESLYVYLEAMAQASMRSDSVHTLSVGLGLGYNELLWAGLGLRKNIQQESWTLHSYESEIHLQKSFCAWLVNQKSPLNETYDEIAQRVSKTFDLAIVDLKNYLVEQKEHQCWELFDELNSSNLPLKRAQCILFDAYSSHTSPTLWQPQFLDNFIAQSAAPQCTFSTYAAKGDLSRALKNHHFEVHLRTGFGGKRHSTWAERRPRT